MTNLLDNSLAAIASLSANSWNVIATTVAVAIVGGCTVKGPSQSDNFSDSDVLSFPSNDVSKSGGENEGDEGSDKPSTSFEPDNSGEESDDDDSEDSPSPNDDDDSDDDDSDDDDSDDDGGPKFDLGTIPDVDVEPNGECKIDFLFVIDSSGSMLDEQVNVVASVPEFITTITSEIEDLSSYHIGIISTDDARGNGQGGSCAQLGGLTIETLTDGTPPNPPNQNKCGPYASGANYMTKDDDLNTAFSCAAQLGTWGDGNERPFDAIKAALSDELSQPGACNEGFLRDDAVLVTVLITDEEDDKTTPEPPVPGLPPPPEFGSQGDPADWHKVIMSAKGDRPEFVVQLSLIGTEKPNECTNLLETGQGGMLVTEGAEISPRIVEYTEMFGDYGVVGDVCAKNYDPFFESAVSVIELACDNIPQG